MAPELTIIIPTRNREDILTLSLTHVMHATADSRVEIIIVNDGDGILEQVQRLFPFVIIIKNQGRGVASARNNGVKKATSEIILFLDDDMWLTHGAVQNIIRFHSDHKCAALNVNWVYPPALQAAIARTAFGRYLMHHQFDSLKGWNKFTPGWDDHRIFQSSGVTSQNLSMRRSCFEKTGGYNEQFPHAGFEDYEFSKNLASHGIPVYIEPKSMTYHNEADRLSLEPWMARRQRGAETQRVAVGLGYSELALRYSRQKRIVLTLLAVLTPLIRLLTTNSFVNNRKMLDKITFRLFDAMFATAIYNGYEHSGGTK